MRLAGGHTVNVTVPHRSTQGKEKTTTCLAKNMSTMEVEVASPISIPKWHVGHMGFVPG